MKLFQVVDNYGKGKRVGDYYVSKAEAKARRKALNKVDDDGVEILVHRISVGPDHWRYV